MEKVLFAADELTGLIWAAALMRPSKSTKDMELKSLKKKYKSKGFAAGCSREVIQRGADQLGCGRSLNIVKDTNKSSDILCRIHFAEPGFLR